MFVIEDLYFLYCLISLPESEENMSSLVNSLRVAFLYDMENTVGKGAIRRQLEEIRSRLGLMEVMPAILIESNGSSVHFFKPK